MINHVEHIHHQLRERGLVATYERVYHVQVGSAIGARHIPAHNQLLFLLNAHQLPAGTIIISDSNSIVIDRELPNLPDVIHEFSGHVEIQYPVDMLTVAPGNNVDDNSGAVGPLTDYGDILDVLFYHVIPQT